MITGMIADKAYRHKEPNMCGDEDVTTDFPKGKPPHSATLTLCHQSPDAETPDSSPAAVHPGCPTGDATLAVGGPRTTHISTPTVRQMYVWE